MYFWVDGLYCETRLEEARPYMLVIIGADATGHKELIGLWDGYHKSEQSWKTLLLDLKSRGSCRGQPWPLGMGRWVSGRRCAKCTGRAAGSGVGYIRTPTCSTNCPKTCSRRPSNACKRSGWPQTARCYWPFMLSPRNTRATFTRPIRSNRRLSSYAHGPTRPAAASPASRC